MDVGAIQEINAAGLGRIEGIFDWLIERRTSDPSTARPLGYANALPAARCAQVNNS
jgi:hypothetical protein